MNASSQTPGGALPPESPVPHSRIAAPFALRPVPVGWPLPAGAEPTTAEQAMPADVRAAYANYGITFPINQTPAHEVTTLAEAVQASPEVFPARAAAAVLDAELVRLAESGDEVTGKGLAAVEESAGLLFDPARAEDIASAARAQVRAEYAADIAERGRQLAMLSDQNQALRKASENRKKSLEAVLHLVEGRPGTDLLTVNEVIQAAGGGQPTSAPITITWDGLVMGPSGDTEGENTLVPCTTARGGPAALVLDDEQRQRLGSLLSLQVRDVNTPCPTAGCGSEEDLDASDPELFGWSRLEIAALGDGPRWYCSDMCVIDALARAGHELAAADREAEQGGDL
ncbi:hypothetical protein [Streptomyces sp. NPDC005760]|uniref:hypothetical protein n=1 Tax=Streptomyces sp. NPDC005760 TaxID=3156718 RepID=UPI0033D14DEE